MAPARRGRPATKQPEKRSSKVLWLCYIGIPVALVLFLVGLGGVAVLLDEPDRQHWYSNTKFAEFWRTLIQKNPFYATIFVNGGAVTILMLGTNLWEHRKAVAAERALQKRVKARKAE
ncbi:hypothetical protein ABPG77_004727 [Micractinium sp. CCAP 211/92]